MTGKQYIKKYQSLLVIFVLFIVPLLGIFFIAFTQKTYEGTDTPFHWQRFLELRYDVGHGILPQFMTHESEPLGDAVNIFYPYETLIPFIILTWFIHTPITLIYSMYFLIWYAMSITSYGSAKSYFNSKRIGLIFSILYTACSTISNTILLNDDFGQVLSFAWLPLILFGFLWVLKDSSHWLMLCMGFTLLIYSHILTTLLMVIVIGILSIFNIKRIISHFHIFLSLIKATILATINTTLFWMPIIYMMMNNKYHNPGQKGVFWMSGLFISHSGEYIRENLGFIDIIGIIIGLMAIILMFNHHRHLYLSRVDWEIWIIGMVMWLCNTNLKFIQHFFSKTSFSVFQFSFRTALPIHICFAYLAIKWLTGYYNNKSNRPRFKRIFIFLCIAFALIMQVGNQLNDKLLFQSRPLYYSTHEVNYGFQLKKLAAHQPVYGHGWTLDNGSFKHMRNTKILEDYQPINTAAKHFDKYQAVGQIYVLLENNKIQKHVILSKNGVKFHNNHSIKNALIPLLWYRGYSYRVTDKNHPIRWVKNKHANFVEIHKLRPGNHLLQIHPILDQVTKISLFITEIGLLIFVSALLERCVRRRYSD